jgi:hypothetical protein
MLLSRNSDTNSVHLQKSPDSTPRSLISRPGVVNVHSVYYIFNNFDVTDLFPSPPLQARLHEGCTMSLNSSLLLAASALPSLVEGVTQAKHFVSLAAAEISTVPDFPGTAEPDNVATISDIDKFLAAFGIDDSEQPENDVQDQDKDHVLPDTGAALVGGPPAGAGSNPITNPLPLIPDPAAQPDPAAPDQPGGAQDGGAAAHEEPGSDSEAGSQHDGAGDDEADEVANEEAAHSDDADQSHEQQEHESDAPSKAETQSSSSSSSSSSSTSHSGGGGGGNGFHIGAGGPDFSGVGPSVAGGFGASLIGHSLLTGDTGISVPGGSGNHDSSAQPPGQVPDMYAAWAAARDAYLAAEQQVEARADEIDDTRCTAGDAMVYIETAKAQIASIEEQISSKVSFITTNLTGIANLNTKIAENDFQIERWIAKRARQRSYQKCMCGGQCNARRSSVGTPERHHHRARQDYQRLRQSLS